MYLSIVVETTAPPYLRAKETRSEPPPTKLTRKGVREITMQSDRCGHRHPHVGGSRVTRYRPGKHLSDTQTQLRPQQVPWARYRNRSRHPAVSTRVAQGRVRRSRHSRGPGPSCCPPSR